MGRDTKASGPNALRVSRAALQSWERPKHMIAHEIAAILLDAQRRRLHALVRPFLASSQSGANERGCSGTTRSPLLSQAASKACEEACSKSALCALKAGCIRLYEARFRQARVMIWRDRALCARQDGSFPLYQRLSGLYMDFSGGKALMRKEAALPVEIIVASNAVKVGTLTFWTVRR